MTWRSPRYGVYQFIIFLKKLLQKPRSEETYDWLFEGGYITEKQTRFLKRWKVKK